MRRAAILMGGVGGGAADATEDDRAADHAVTPDADLAA